MMSTALQSLVGFLDRRFVLTTWLPSLLFWSGLLSLAVTAAGWPAAVRWWARQPVGLSLLLVVLALAWTTFSAYLLAATRDSLVRLFEGYWDRLPGGRRLAERQRTHHRQVLSRLQEEDYDAVYLKYPATPTQVMPTQFGNILKSSEVYPYQRYKIDGVLVWPRLYSALPDGFVTALAAAKADLDLMVAVSVLGAGFAALGGLLATLVLPWYAAPACIWGGALIAWLGYQGMLRNALPYTEFIKTAFDIHRGTLLTTIGWQLPSSYGAERRQWTQIGNLWYRGAPTKTPEVDGAALLGYPMQLGEPPRKPADG